MWMLCELAGKPGKVYNFSVLIPVTGCDFVQELKQHVLYGFFKGPLNKPEHKLSWLTKLTFVGILHT